MLLMKNLFLSAEILKDELMVPEPAIPKLLQPYHLKP
jgi:hypothetical protein